MEINVRSTSAIIEMNCLVVMDKSCNACDNDDTVDIENRVGTDYKLLQ